MPPKKGKKADLKKAKKEERLKRLQEEELARQIAEEKERKRKEEEACRIRQELERIKLEEDEIRQREQNYLKGLFANIDENFKTYTLGNWNDQQWYCYVNVWKAMNPLSLPMVNARLSKWVEDENIDIQVFFKKCHQFMQIVYEVERAIWNCPLQNYSFNSWSEILGNIKLTMAQKADFVTFHLLRNASAYINSDSYNMEYGCADVDIHTKSETEHPSITLCLWVNFVKNVRFRGLDLPELGFNFQLPEVLALKSCAVRIYHTLYDNVTCLISELSHNNVEDTDSIEDLDEELESITNATEAVADDNIPEMSGNIEPTVPSGDSEAPISPSFPSSITSEDCPDTEMSIVDDQNSSSIKSSSSNISVHSVSDTHKDYSSTKDLEGKTDEVFDINEYYLVGGIYNFDLLRIPTQPVEVGTWIMIFKEEMVSKRMPFKTTIRPIRKPPANMSPAISAEFISSEVRRFEREMVNAISLTLKLPKAVVFMEKPVPALWNNKEGFTVNNFFDVRQEDDDLISFKMNQFGKIGLLQRKYANHPFQRWELHPGKEDNSALITLIGRYLSLVIKIHSNGCYIESIKQENTEILKFMYSKCMSPKEMIQKLMSVGIFLRYEEGCGKYIGLTEKNSYLEDWAYRCISLLCTLYHFSSSRWNKDTPELVLNCKSAKVLKLSQNHLIMIKNGRAIYLDCSEEHHVFSHCAVADQKFSSDLYYLLTSEASEGNIKVIQEIEKNFSVYVCTMLQTLKLFSCS